MSVSSFSLTGKCKDSDNEPQGSKVVRKDCCFKAGNKALRGEPHGRFKHEIRLKESKNEERQEGSQTLEVFVTGEASPVPEVF